MPRFVVRGIVIGVAAAGVVGQAIVAALVTAAVLSVFGWRSPLAFFRRTIHGVELWLAFAVTAVASTGSLFFSEVAHFPVCEICWYQRYCMYPLAIVLLPVAARDARRVAPWVLPIPLVGAALAVYHVLIEQGLALQFTACLQSLCALQWIHEFGFVTIPTLALTAFALVIALLVFATRDASPDASLINGRSS